MSFFFGLHFLSHTHKNNCVLGFYSYISLSCICIAISFMRCTCSCIEYLSQCHSTSIAALYTTSGNSYNILNAYKDVFIVVCSVRCVHDACIKCFYCFTFLTHVNVMVSSVVLIPSPYCVSKSCIYLCVCDTCAVS